MGDFSCNNMDLRNSMQDCRASILQNQMHIEAMKITMMGRCVAEFSPHFAPFCTMKKRSCISWSQAGIFARGNLSREVRAHQTARTMTLCDHDGLPM